MRKKIIRYEKTPKSSPSTQIKVFKALNVTFGSFTGDGFSGELATSVQ